MVVLAFIMGACSQVTEVNSEISGTTIDRLNEDRWGEIPFENEVVLKSFTADSQILDYDTVRKLAVVELIVSGIDEEMGWEGHKIKPEPVVIYGFDNRPKYYDFIVIDAEEQAVGTITTYARRTATTTIRGVSAGIKDYRSVLSKAGGSPASLFESWNGGSYVGLLGKAGETPEMVIDAETGESAGGITEIEGEEIITTLLESDFFTVLNTDPSSDIVIDENDPLYEEIQRAIAAYNETAKTPEEIEASLRLSLLQHTDQTAAFWEVINELLPQLDLIEDEDEFIDTNGKGLISFIKSVVQGNVVKVVANVVQSAVLSVVHTVNTLVNGVDTNLYCIGKYTSYTETFRSGSSQCGPWVCSYLVWIKEGIDKKKDTYQSFYNLSSSFGELHVLNFVLRVTPGGRPMTPAEMAWSLPSVSGGKIWFRDTWEFSDAIAYDHIKIRKKPAILLCDSNGQLHYKIAVGARATGSAFSETHYFLMHENKNSGSNAGNRCDNKNEYKTVEWWHPWFMVED